MPMSDVQLAPLNSALAIMEVCDRVVEQFELTLVLMGGPDLTRALRRGRHVANQSSSASSRMALAPEKSPRIRAALQPSSLTESARVNVVVSAAKSAFRYPPRTLAVESTSFHRASSGLTCFAFANHDKKSVVSADARRGFPLLAIGARSCSNEIVLFGDGISTDYWRSAPRRLAVASLPVEAR